MRYFYHRYGRTWSNERTVEVPIAESFLSKCKPGRILEIGNTLGHYLAFAHDTLDKYEGFPGVVNKDIANFAPKQKYDVILSISTMEHIGYDAGEASEPGKFWRAMMNVIDNCLGDNGHLLVTMPLGYRPEVDEFIRDKARDVFSELYFMRRISWDNRWCQTEYGDVAKLRFDSPYPAANAIVVGMLHKRSLTKATAMEANVIRAPLSSISS